MPTVTNPNATSITSATANLGGTVSSTGGATLTKRGILYSMTATDPTPTLGGVGVTEIDDAAATTGAFTEAISGLTPGTVYSFVAFASNSVGTSYTNPVSNFTSLAVVPTVTSPTATSITSSKASLGGTVASTGGATLTKRGILYCVTATNSTPTLGGVGVTEIDDAAATTGAFIEASSSLTPGTVYSFVAFATNSVGTSYTNPVSSFTTPASAPVVASPTAISIAGTTATLGGTVVSTGGAALTNRGVLYVVTTVNASPILGGNGVVEVDDPAAATGNFTEAVTGLSPGTVYSFVAFATNSVGTSYTSPVSSFTSVAVAPTVTNPSATSITSVSVTLGGTVASNGGATLGKRGVLFVPTATNPNPILGGAGVIEVDDPSAVVGSFMENINGLLSGTSYSFVAFATNSAGVSYTSPVSTFTTNAAQATLGTLSLLENAASGSDSDLVISTAAWTATANASWLHTSANGSGNGLATFTFDANSGTTRTGTLIIAGLQMTVTQAGSGYGAASSVPLLSGLSSPSDVAVDSSGNVYIAATGNNSIEEWHASTQTVTTLISSGLNSPAGVAVDGSGNIYIADTGDNAIKEWHSATQTLTTLVSSGLSLPSGVAVDGSGNVLIADTYNSDIKEWHVSTQTVTTLISSGLYLPDGVAVDSSGNVYIADTYDSADQGVACFDADGYHPCLLRAELSAKRGGGRIGQCLHSRYQRQRHQGVACLDADGFHTCLVGAPISGRPGGRCFGQRLHRGHLQ